MKNKQAISNRATKPFVRREPIFNEYVAEDQPIEQVTVDKIRVKLLLDILIKYSNNGID